MFGTSSTVNFALGLFIIIIMMNHIHAENSKVVYDASYKEEDINSLVPIKFEQALPMIIFAEENHYVITFSLPIELTQVEIKNGRIWSSKTEFHTMPAQKQIFLCPTEETNVNCLEPTEFLETQALQCDRTLTPKIIKNPNEKSCGAEGTGTSMAFVYSPYKFATPFPSIYQFCYSTSLKKNLYVFFPMKSPRLLSKELLVREREVKFEMSTETNGLIDSEFHTILEADLKRKPRYKFQKLVPPKYMPFAVWRKPTYHYINIALQHEALFELWDEINDRIKTNAIEMFVLPRTIAIGVFDIPQKNDYISGGENEMPNFWIQVVADLNLSPFKAIAILMNNFVSEETNKKHYIDDICKQDLCIGSLKKLFTQVGGQVRCCVVSEEIASLFHTKTILSFEEILPIRDITFSV